MVALARMIALRLVQGVTALLVLSVLLFRLLGAMPGDPVDLIVASNPNVRPEDLARLKRLRGFDQPWYVQYARWAWGWYEGYQAPRPRLPSTLPTNDAGAFELDLGTLVEPAPGEGSFKVAWAGPAVNVSGTIIRGTRSQPGRHTVAVVLASERGVETAVSLVITVGAEAQVHGPGVDVRPFRYAWPGEPVAVALGGVEEGDAVDVVRGRNVDAMLDGREWFGAWEHEGQDVLVLAVGPADHPRHFIVQPVDHGPIPDPTRFQPGVLRGELGHSQAYKLPVMDVVRGRLGASFRLVIPALLLSLLIAIPLGVLAARRPRSWLDRLCTVGALSGMSIPVFWLGLLLITVFAVQLRWLPPGGMNTPGSDDVIDGALHAVLPVTALALVYAGRWLRHVRSSMLEVLGAPWVLTARAKGLSEMMVVWKHAFRAAVVPLVTVVALSLPGLFSGAVLTETVFSWPGMGRLVFDSVMNADHYVAMIAFMGVAVMVLVANLAADLAVLALDPRLRVRR